MSQLKYIVLDNVFPIIFGDYFTHKDVALRTLRLASYAGGEPIVTGAGFFTVNKDLECTTYGRSESLDKDPASTDKTVLTCLIRGIQ